LVFSGIFIVEIHGEKIYFEFPVLKNIGMLSETRKSFPKQQMVIIDPTSRLRSVIFFGDKKKLDQVEGVITDIPLNMDMKGDLQKNRSLPLSKKKRLINIGFSDLVSDPKKPVFKSFMKKFNQKKEKKTNVSIEGSWISNLIINSKEFWNPEMKKFNYKFVEDPIPSDLRFREDILWLRKENYTESQKWKIKIESVMRQERKNREEMNKQKKRSGFRIN
jgi:hypothetical protein